ncbi:MAG: PEP-CTERM sorting domain-containing protein [Pirellulales bacterium]
MDNDDVTLLGVFYDPTAAPLPVAAVAANSVTAVPEPSAIALAALAAVTAAISVVVRRRCKAES